MDRVEILEFASADELERVCPGGAVYNIEVEGTHTYLANGIVVHNCHNLRNLGAQRTEAVQSASTFAARAWGLTASLLYNEGAKLHNVLSVIDGTGWGGFGEWAQRYTDAHDGEWGLEGGRLMRGDTAPELRERLAEVYMRRTRQDVWAELPFEAQFQMVKLDAPTWAAPGANVGQIAKAARKLAEYKTPFVVEQILSDRAARVPTLTVTWLREHAEALHAKVPGSLLSLGGDGDRLTLIINYVQACSRSGETPTLISTMDGISEGANLQWAKAINFAALDYLAEKVRQVVGRAVRMGQQGQVPVRFFVAKRTIDEAMTARIVAQLRSQGTLEGRTEADKRQLEDVLSERNIEADMKALWEKYAKEEQNQ